MFYAYALNYFSFYVGEEIFDSFPIKANINHFISFFY